MPWRSRSSWNHSSKPWLSGQTCGRTSPHYATLCNYDGSAREKTNRKLNCDTFMWRLTETQFRRYRWGNECPTCRFWLQNPKTNTTCCQLWRRFQQHEHQQKQQGREWWKSSWLDSMWKNGDEESGWCKVDEWNYESNDWFSIELDTMRQLHTTSWSALVESIFPSR